MYTYPSQRTEVAAVETRQCRRWRPCSRSSSSYPLQKTSSRGPPYSGSPSRRTVQSSPVILRMRKGRCACVYVGAQASRSLAGPSRKELALASKTTQAHRRYTRRLVFGPQIDAEMRLSNAVLVRAVYTPPCTNIARSGNCLPPRECQVSVMCAHNFMWAALIIIGVIIVLVGNINLYIRRHCLMQSVSKTAVKLNNICYNNKLTHTLRMQRIYKYM